MSINNSFDVRKKMSGMFFECHVCRKPGVDNINAAYRLLSVTSDCKPMDQVFEAGFCHNCGCVVGAVDKKWWSNVNQIYENYEIYDLSGGIKKFFSTILTVFINLVQICWWGNCYLLKIERKI